MLLVFKGDVTTKWSIYARDATTLQGATGKASTLGSNAFIGKNSGALAAVGGTFTERDATKSPGHYLYTPGANDTDTAGPVDLTTAASSGVIISISVPIQVINWDPSKTIAALVWDAVKNASPVSGSYGEDVSRPNFKAVTGTLGAGAFSTNIDTTAAALGANCFQKIWLCWLAGAANAGQCQQILSNTSNANSVITMVTAFTNAPANNDPFLLINR